MAVARLRDGGGGGGGGGGFTVLHLQIGFFVCQSYQSSQIE